MDPIAYDAPGIEGIVDLHLMPTDDDMASLTPVEGRWQIHDIFPDRPAAAGMRQPEVTMAFPTSNSRRTSCTDTGCTSA